MTKKRPSFVQRAIGKGIRILKGGKKTPEKPPAISSELMDVCQRVRESRLTYLSANTLHSLVYLMNELERNEVEGKIIEAGCALGGSSIALCSAKKSIRPMEIYDTFEMIPPPSEKDGKDVHERYETIRNGEAVGIQGDEYYGYLKDIPERVVASFEKFGNEVKANNVSLHQGLVQDTLSVNEPIALAHIDVDWYDPVFVCLERVLPFLSKKGAIVLDDYFAWSGCKRATDDFFASRKEEFTFCGKYGHMIVRFRDPS